MFQGDHVVSPMKARAEEFIHWAKLLHKLFGFNNKNALPHRSGSWKSESKVLAELFFSEGESIHASLSFLWMLASLQSPLSLLCVHVQISLFYQDSSHIGLGAYLPQDDLIVPNHTGKYPPPT